MLQRGHSGDGCDLASTLWKYDLKKETIDVCIWRMFVFMSVVVIVWGSVGMSVE